MAFTLTVVVNPTAAEKLRLVNKRDIFDGLDKPDGLARLNDRTEELVRMLEGVVDALVAEIVART